MKVFILVDSNPVGETFNIDLQKEKGQKVIKDGYHLILVDCNHWLAAKKILHKTWAHPWIPWRVWSAPPGYLNCKYDVFLWMQFLRTLEITRHHQKTCGQEWARWMFDILGVLTSSWKVKSCISCSTGLQSMLAAGKALLFPLSTCPGRTCWRRMMWSSWLKLPTTLSKTRPRASPSTHHSRTPSCQLMWSAISLTFTHAEITRPSF